MMKTLILNRDFPSGDITLLDGQLVWFPQFLALPQADEALTQLKPELNWQQNSIRLFGKTRSSTSTYRLVW